MCENVRQIFIQKYVTKLELFFCQNQRQSDNSDWVVCLGFSGQKF
jgi:hypothetical protein